MVAVMTVDKWGRVSLLTTGVSMMLVALCLLTVAFSFSYVSESDCNALTLEDDCQDEYGTKCTWNTDGDCLYSNCTASGE